MAATRRSSSSDQAGLGRIGAIMSLAVDDVGLLQIEPLDEAQRSTNHERPKCPKEYIFDFLNWESASWRNADERTVLARGWLD